MWESLTKIRLCTKFLIINQYSQVFQCENCSNFHVKPFAVEKAGKIKISRLDLPSVQCDICKGKYTIGGPIWLAEINDLSFVEKVKDFMDKEKNPLKLASEKKINGVLSGILNVKLESQIIINRIMYKGKRFRQYGSCILFR